MNSRFIIIAILIMIKVIGVASRVRAESYFPENYSSCYSAKQVNYIIKKENYYNPVYRCGQSKYNSSII